MMNNFLYIDPGTGSMLFSLAIGIATAAVFGIRALSVKLMFIFSGGKINKLQNEKIPYLIFSDHKRYWNVFKPICDEFEKRKVNLVYYTMSEDDPALSEKYEFVKAKFIGEGNKGIARMNNVNAGTVIATTPQLDVIQWKRSKNVDKYVHVPHSVDELAGYRMFGLDFYDTVLCTGENQVDFIKKMEKLRPNAPKKTLVVVGSPNMDEAFKRIKNFEEPHNEIPIVLLAPSWGASSILNRFGENLINSLLNSGFKIIVRPHPQSYTVEKEMLENLRKNFADKEVEWNSDNDNLAVMSRSDILITDFSGIIFDYALLFNRPLIYADTKVDNSPYDTAWLEKANEKRWLFEAAERIGLKLEEKDFGNIKKIILDILNNLELQEAREKVKRECWSNIGNSTKLIVDYITESNKIILEEK